MMRWFGKSVNVEQVRPASVVHFPVASIVYDGPPGLAVVHFSAEFRGLLPITWASVACSMQVVEVATGNVLVQGTSGPDMTNAAAHFFVGRQALVDLVPGRAYQLGHLDTSGASVVVANGFTMTVL